MANCCGSMSQPALCEAACAVHQPHECGRCFVLVMQHPGELSTLESRPEVVQSGQGFTFLTHKRHRLFAGRPKTLLEAIPAAFRCVKLR